MLSDNGIRDAMRLGDLSIEPYNEGQMQPASYDVRLGKELIERRNVKTLSYLLERDGKSSGSSGEYTREFYQPLVVDPYSEKETRLAFYESQKIETVGYALMAGKLVLVATEEVITLGPNMSAQIVGKSSLARHGLIVESAGFIDPGFSGSITCELAVLAGGVRLYAGMPIAQIVFTRLDSPTSKPYQGKYGGTKGPQLPAYWKNARPS